MMRRNGYDERQSSSNHWGGWKQCQRNTQDEFLKAEHIGELKTFFDIEPEGVESVIKLNFMGTWIPTQVFTKDMIGKKEGSIINISSMNAYTPLTTIPGYSGAKAAIILFFMMREES